MPFNSLYTWDQAETELNLRLGNRNDLGVGAGTTDRIARWLNAAQYRIAACVLAAEDLDQTLILTTVDGQSEYSEQSIIPPLNNAIGIKDMRNNNVQGASQTPDMGLKMRRFPWTEYRSLSQQAQSPPLRWARFGYIIALDPQPDSNGPYTIKIDYRMQPQQDTVQIPNWAQEDWITVAEYIAWKALMKPDRAQAAINALPPAVALKVSQPLDRDQWESMWDTDQVIAPIGFDYPYMASP